MKVIGLTGGIGSGKSTLLNWFQEQGIPCFESDTVGKKLLETQLRDAVGTLFGGEIFDADGHLNRSALAAIVFQDATALAALNDLVHPAVAKAFEDFKKEHHNAPFVINEAAILFETGGYKKCDFVILVKAPKEKRIQRIKARDGFGEAEILARMKNQWSDQKKEPLADYVIENKTLEDTFAQASKLIKILKS